MCYNGGMKNMPLFLLFLSTVLSAFAAPSADELLKAVPAECSDTAYLQFNATGKPTPKVLGLRLPSVKEATVTVRAASR